MEVDIAVLLGLAMDLVVQKRPDIKVMSELLDCIPLDDLDTHTRCAISHAQSVTTAALNEDSGRATLARFALFRVVGLIERHVENGKT